MESGTKAAARWLPAPPDISDEPLVVVAEALVPIFDWMDVAVVRAVQQKLSAVERFLIETALELGDLDVEDVEELTGLPEEATRRIAGHLCEISVLNAVAGRYTASEDAARATLARESLIELRQDVLTFLVLPRSGDVLAFEHKQGRAAPPQVHRLDPVASAPVPGAYRDATQAAVLRTLLDAGQVAGLPEDVTGMAEPQDDKPVPDVCPAYRYAGRLRLRSGQVRAKGHIYGERGEERVPLNLSRASRLVDHWLDQAELLYLTEVFQAACAEIGCSAADAKARRAGASHWAFQVNAQGARDIAERGVPLCRPSGLELLSADGTTKIEVMVSFETADSGAGVVFAVDAAADMLEDLPPESLTPPDLGQAIASACSAYQVEASPEMKHMVRTRLWTRGHHYPVYKLRAGEDFDYE
jgi:hypothetical protein